MKSDSTEYSVSVAIHEFFRREPRPGIRGVEHASATDRVSPDASLGEVFDAGARPPVTPLRSCVHLPPALHLSSSASFRREAGRETRRGRGRRPLDRAARTPTRMRTRPAGASTVYTTLAGGFVPRRTGRLLGRRRNTFRRFRRLPPARIDTDRSSYAARSAETATAEGTPPRIFRTSPRVVRAPARVSVLPRRAVRLRRV